MTDHPRPARILTVDDDPDSQLLLRAILTQGGYEVFQISGGDRIIEAINTHRPDLVITDIMMPGITGGVVYQMIRQKVGFHLPILVCSGTTLRIRETDSLVAFCHKPISPGEFLHTIESLLDQAARPGPSTDSDRPEAGMEDLD